MSNKNLKLLSLILVLFIIVACSSMGGGPSEENAPVDEPTPSEAGGGEEPVITDEVPAVSESELCANEYYPVSEGATWSYDVTSSIEDYSFTNTVSSIRLDGFTLSIDFDNLAITQEWACTPEGLLALQMGGGNAGLLTTGDTHLELETQNASGITYPKNIQPGDSWTYALSYNGSMSINGEPAEANGDTQSNYTAIGIESVTVPAGTFDAMKIETTNTINIISTFQGTTVPITFTGTTTTWLAPGVGWVKSVSSSEFGGITSSETVELQSYSVP